MNNMIRLYIQTSDLIIYLQNMEIQVH